MKEKVYEYLRTVPKGKEGIVVNGYQVDLNKYKYV